ncbi:MAG: sugar ABC transporter substrate-binding protein [Paracoccus sp. BP8]|nr:MAG: sugar ABC transporter substrate-binding protein [Paracoccus sp. BP8]
MKAKTILAGAVALALSALPLAAQESGVDNPTRNAVLKKLQGKRVVYIPMNMSVDLTIGWNEIMQRQAREYGYTVDVRDANWSTEAGSRALTAAISEKPDLVVLQNPDVQSYARLIQQATNAGVKVLQLNMESLVQSDAYTGADWVGIGYTAGKEVAARCAPGQGSSTKAQIVMGVPTGPSDLYQVFGFKQALAEAGDEIQIVSQQAAAYDPTRARSITASVLQQHPDLCASFGIWDSMDAGTGAAIKEAGKQDQVFVVTSGGGAQASCDKINEDIFDMLVAYDVRQQGAAINTLISSMLQSDQPAGSGNTTVYTLNTPITKDNMTPNSCWSMDDLN